MATKRKNPPRNATKTTPKTVTSTSRASGNRLVFDYMGCTLTEDQKKNWRALISPKRTLKVTKFFDQEALRQLGVLESVEVLLGRAGLSEFLAKGGDTYKRLTLEFLSTVERVPESDPPSIKFQLMNKETVLSYHTLREIFGVAPRADTEKWSGTSSWAATNEFWYALTHQRSTGRTQKSSRIPHPAFRFIHRVIAMTFLCQGEPTNIPRLEIEMLWGMGPEGVGRPDWVSEFIKVCIDIRGANTGKIAMGGMVTLIATHLGYELDPRDRVRGTSSLNIDSMCRHMQMIARVDCEEFAYALQTGTTIKTPYLRLPRPEGVLIPVGPCDRDLYIPPDPPEMVGLDSSKGKNAIVDGSGDVAMEEADGSGEEENGEDEAADNTIGDTSGGEALVDTSWRGRVEADLEDLRDEIEAIHDQNKESLALQRAMSDMFKDMYPESYKPPEESFYAKLATKRLEREARARARQPRRSCFGSCFGSPSS